MSAELCDDGQAVGGLLLAEVDEEHLRGCGDSFGIEVELIQDIVDAVCAKANPHSTQAWHAEDAGQVVIAATACDAAYLDIEGLHLEDAAGIVVEAAGKGEVELEHAFQRTQSIRSTLIIQTIQTIQSPQHILHFVEAFLPYFAALQHIAHGLNLLLVCAAEVDDGLQLLNGFLADAVLAKLFVHGVEPYLVELVDGNGDVHYLVGLAYHFSYA